MKRSELDRIVRASEIQSLGVQPAVKDLVRIQDALQGSQDSIERAIRAAVGPLEAMRQFHRESAAFRQFQGMQTALDSFQARFRLSETAR